MARRSGEIEDISANVVYTNDDFDFELGASPKLIHKPDFRGKREDADIVGAYMVAFLKGNERPHIEFMTREQIEKVKRISRASGSGPWKDHYPEMCRKTVVRRGVKYLPMSTDLVEAIQIGERSLSRA